MKFLLSALAGLSITSAAIATPLTTQVSQNSSSNYAESKTIDLGETVKISSNQGSAEWSLDFDFGIIFNAAQIAFQGGGLKVYVDWGDSNWDYSWTGINVRTEETGVIFKDEHQSGAAKQTGMLSYKLENVGGTAYKLTFILFTRSFDSIVPSWGEATIGNRLTITI